MQGYNHLNHRSLLCFCGRLFLGLVLSSLTLLPIAAFIPRKWNNYATNSCNLDICISNTGIHTNIIVPIKTNTFDWRKFIFIDEIGKDAPNDYNYLSFGWGDRDFYMSTPSIADLKLSTAFNALFLPTPSVLDVKGYKLIPSYLQVKCITVSNNDYLQLIKFIQASFQVDRKGRKIRLGDGHSSNAGFYAAVGNYSILRNCNTWTAEGLRKMNVNTPLWDGLSLAIMLHLKSSCKS